MTSYTEIKVELRSNLGIITLNRPLKKNALNSVMYGEITSALNELSENKNTTITAITGSGDYYSSGTDLKVTVVDSYDKFILDTNKKIRNFISAFINHRKVLVAVVNGPAIGIAVTTLALCDVVYCSDSATFQTPFTRLGLTAEGCSSYTFPRIMGTSKASELLLFNHTMTSGEALRVGFVAEVYTKEQINSKLWPELENKANVLPKDSLKYSKELMRHFVKDKLHEANFIECNRLLERMKSEEFFKAVISFKSPSRL